MTHSALQAEQLVVLPTRLETITIRNGDVAQRAPVSQINFNNQIGGDCIRATCTQSNMGINVAYVNESATSTTNLTDVIEDNRQMAQLFFFGPAG
jgi:hypothetical protein